MSKGRILVILALVAASCGGSNEPASAPTTATAVASSDSGVTTTSAIPQATDDVEPSEVSTGEAVAPFFDGPPAPDFELVLNDGSTFKLSDEQKPVYVVFWAEW